MSSPFDPSHYAGVLWGLGNPGPAYFGTRHNLGAMAVSALAEAAEPLSDFRKLARAWRLEDGGKKFLLLVNWVYVNESGAIAEDLLSQGFKPEQVMVLVDDLSLSFGSLRIREGGSSGGHNGLKGIEAALGSNYPRVRMGIGPEGEVASLESENWKEFVLGRFSPEEEKALPEFTKDAGRAARDYFHQGLINSRNTWNRRGLPKTST